MEVGITEKASRNIIADLEADGYVTKKRVGRRIRYRIHPDLPMRHEMEQDKAVSDLLNVFGRKRRRIREEVA
jgi:DNA-binding transcriptional regulator PaaX